MSQQPAITKSGQTSFRRILLGRILLLSVPVLMLGLAVTYRKARSSLLETARQNLSESAIRKGESVQEFLNGLKLNVLYAGEHPIFESGSSAEKRQFLEHLQTQLPGSIHCIQLVELEQKSVVASTCGSQAIAFNLPGDRWLPTRTSPILNTSEIDVELTLQHPTDASASQSHPLPNAREFGLILSTPVYVGQPQPAAPSLESDAPPTERLRYALQVSTTLRQENADPQPLSLAGYTVVIDEDGTILEHPNDPIRVGRKITEDPAYDRLSSAVRGALSGRQDFLHIQDFDREGRELLTGYTAIKSPLDPDNYWIVLAVTPLEYALAGLTEIQRVLLTLVLGLLAANLLATLFIARALALPIEQISEYARTVQSLPTAKRIPYKFGIQEFNQLVLALDRMVERLKDWAQELEAAWKEAKIANQLKNEFLANISHELRTPLNAIIGCIRLVLDDCCDSKEEEKDLLARADEAAIHLLDIINDVLDIAKIEAGKLSVELKPVHLQQVLKETVDMQIARIHQKGLELHVCDLSDRPINVQADPAKLKQVLTNILENAVKFTDAGSVTITTTVHRLSENGDTPTLAPVHDGNASHVAIAIQDTGIGIEPHLQQRLFQPFVMLDGSSTRKHGGTGLGLAISRNLMELMGGTILLESAGKNKGTTVTSILPLSPIPYPAGKAH